MEQRIAIKFCFKLGKNTTETVQMLKTAYGDQALSKSQVCRWFKLLKEGREDVQDEARSGRPSTTKTDVNVDKLSEVLRADRRQSVRMLSEETGIPKTIVHEIVSKNLGMRKICCKLVPKVLTNEQKVLRMEMSQENLELIEEDPTFLNNVITGDESWVFEYDPTTKRQSCEWHTPDSPRPKKARMSKSKVKTMLIAFFDIRGLVHHEFVPAGTTVNAAFYVEVLKRLKKRVNRIRPDIADNWKLHHDNAPAHTAFIVTNYLTKAGIPTISQPPYSPDLAPPDFFLFPRLKGPLKGHHFETVENIQAACTAELKSIPEEAYSEAYNAWKKRWRRCVDAGGAYFEDY